MWVHHGATLHCLLEGLSLTVGVVSCGFIMVPLVVVLCNLIRSRRGACHWWRRPHREDLRPPAVFSSGRVYSSFVAVRTKPNCPHNRLMVGRPAGCSAEGDSCGSELPGWGRVGGVYQQSLVCSFPFQCCISGIFDRDFVSCGAAPFHLMVYHG
jgi:hypothetical protein